MTLLVCLNAFFMLHKMIFYFRNKTCKLHLIIPFTLKKYKCGKGNQCYTRLFDWFEYWNVMNIAHSVDKKWQLIWHCQIDGEQFCHRLFKGFHIRHRDGTKYQFHSKYVGYFILKRCNENQNHLSAYQ